MREAAVIIGASSGLGRALANRLSSEGVDCILAARHERDLIAISGDLQLRYNIAARTMVLDLGTLNHESSDEWVAECFNLFKGINQVYITAAMIADEDHDTHSLEILERTTAVNYLGTALLIGGFAKRLQGTPSNITIISSIAAIRPRSNNLSYAASKIALEYFAGGLRHYYSKDLCRIQVYRIGYMDTGMSAEKKLLFRKKDPHEVADHIFRRKHKDTGLVYYPKFWGLIAVVIKLMPWYFYKRLRY